MSKITVVTWNAEGMFVAGTRTRRATPHDALNVLRTLNADIVVVPEFGKFAKLHEEIETTIKALGYQICSVAYNDERVPGLGFVILSRLQVLNQQNHQIGTTFQRTLLELTCVDEMGQKLRILGVHLDDRTEEIRLQQISDVAKVVNSQPSVPTLLLGDFNAMSGKTQFAKLARTKLASSVAKNIHHKQLHNMATRVHEMAYGTTIEYIQNQTHMHDLDGKYKRTISAKQTGVEWMPKLRLAKIDWIFGSKQFKVLSYKILRDVGSDHRPVKAVLEY